LNIEDDLGIKKTTILLVDGIIQKDGFINKRSRFLEHVFEIGICYYFNYSLPYWRCSRQV